MRCGAYDELYDCFDEHQAMDFLGMAIDGPTLDGNSYEYRFLFDVGGVFTSGIEYCRRSETPQQTADRIRKFVYYKLRKAEIFAEYNEGLRTGDHLYQCNGDYTQYVNENVQSAAMA